MRHNIGMAAVLGLATVLGLGSLHALRPRGTGEAGGKPPGGTEVRVANTAPGESKTLEDVSLPTESGDPLAFMHVVVTGYTSCPRETDSTPFITASMTRVRPGCLALSRDLLRTFTRGAPFDFGDWVVLPGVGVFIVEDTMNARWRGRADIWFHERHDALHWGRRQASIALLPIPVEGGSDLFALGPRLGR